MSARDLLFEIGTEEIPARFMEKAMSDMSSYALEEFDAYHIDHEDISVYCTPRRLTLIIKNVSESQRDSVETAKGPLKSQAYDALGNPTKAALGFAKSRGVDVASLRTETIGNAEYVVAEKRESGKDSVLVLPEILEKIMKRLSFPKSMYWADKNVRFARPVRWLVVLFGDQVLPVVFGDVKSGRVTRGHRFMGSDSIEIADVSEYAKAMEDNYVSYDPECRKKRILEGIACIENELCAKVDVDDALLMENVHLNEYPTAFYGSFDEEFLEIPEEVLTLSMAKNQRYFPVRDASGRLMPNFVGVSNNLAKDMKVVRSGNERVLRARLHDASFFWKEDQLKSLDDMTEELKSVTYQEQLGSVYDKVQRVKRLALQITEKLGACDIKPYVARAAQLAKADLVSNMVYEFADVQGVMGREYARKAKEDERVALAIYEQYLPRFAGDKIPSSLEGAILGMAERADTIASIYKIGLEPTSSQDPYGLRRAARCINEIIWGMSIDMDTDELISKAALPLNLDAATLSKISTFLSNRLQVQLRERGFKYEVVALAMQTIPTRPLQALSMSCALQKVSDEPWFAELINAAVRVKNLLAKATDESYDINTSKFTENAEKALYNEITRHKAPVSKAVAEFEWESLAVLLSELAPVISDFFCDVLVMDNDISVRNNRLALLKECQDLFSEIGDFSLLK